MEGKALGICLSILGVTGLVLAFWGMSSGDSSKHLAVLFASGISGALVFFTGLWLIPRRGDSAAYRKPSAADLIKRLDKEIGLENPRNI
jgi:hypothetical protein